VLAAGLVGAARDAHTAPRAAAPGQAAAERTWPGKPQPAIAVEYRVSAAAAAGVPLVVTITARTSPSLGTLALEVRTADGSRVPSRPIVGNARAGEHAWEVRLTPSVVPAFLNVLVTADGAAGPLARSIVVPLGGATRPGPEVRIAPLDGERILVLPGQESRGSR
jgi:hypothetical protein